MGILYSTYQNYNDEDSNNDNNKRFAKRNPSISNIKSINPNPIRDYTWYFHNKQNDNGIIILNNSI